MVWLLLVVNQLLNKGIRMIILVLWLLKLAVKATLARLTLLEVCPCEVRDDVTLLDQCRIPNHHSAPNRLILNGAKVVDVRCR